MQGERHDGGEPLNQPLAVQIPVGRMAPDFEADAWIPEDGTFGSVSLSNLRGQWVLLNFYSSDFTFV